MPQRRARLFVIAALVVGTLDILDPIIFYAFRGVKPIRILQSVAAGILGKESYAGGWKSALLGLACHFFIATVVVAIYFLASRKLRVLTEHPIVMGALYGIGVHLVMKFIVIPLSNAKPGAFAWPAYLNLIFAHVFLIGIPTALFARAANRD